MEMLDKQIVKPLNLEIFSDERLTVRDNSDNTKWMYFGTLFVREEKKDLLIQHLNNLRCIKSNNWHPEMLAHVMISADITREIIRKFTIRSARRIQRPI